MEGLLVKDIRMLWRQKKVIGGLLLFVMVFTLTKAFSAAFSAGYLIFLCVLLVETTVSYDEAGNGYAFLFSLPVERWEYVAEKYLLGLMAGLTAAGISLVLAAVSGGLPPDYLWKLAGFFLGCQLFLWIILPAQLWLGTSGSRYLLMAGGILFAGLMLSRNWLASHLGSLIHLVRAFNAHRAAGAALLLVLSILLLACSAAVSMRVMNRKEF